MKESILIFILLTLSACGGGHESEGMCYVSGAGECPHMTESQCQAAGGHLVYMCPIFPFNAKTSGKEVWEAEEVVISGFWKLYLMSEDSESGSACLLLEQIGSDLTGIYTYDGIKQGINGNVKDLSLAFDVTAGSLSFLGEASGDAISGTWSAVNGPSGTWRAEKNDALCPE